MIEFDNSKNSTELNYKYIIFKTNLQVEHWGEAIAVVGASNTHTGGHNHLTSWVKVGKSKFVKVTKVWLGVVELIDLVVILDDGIKKRGKDSVAFWVTGVHTNTGVCVLTS